MACQKTETVSVKEPVLTKASISISTAGALSKANAPLEPDVENLIHDVWLIQFSERGVLYTGVDRFYRTGGEYGARFITLEAEVMSGKSTICLLANLKKANTPTKTFFDTDALEAGLPDNLPDFRNTLLDMTDFLHHVNTNTKPVAIPLFGYWEGTITSDVIGLEENTVNVTMGRMLSRINLNITNESDSRLVQLKWTNAASKAYYFPQISSEALPDDAYCTRENAITYNLDLASTYSGSIYFYWAPNFCYGEEKATTLTFTSEEGKSYSCLVTNGALSDADPDYNLYHNCNYTLSATVK